MMSNLYQCLGVPSDASQGRIKKAFRKLTKEWHPDRNKDNVEEASEKYKGITNAYEILSDEQRRRQYDLSRKLPSYSYSGGNFASAPKTFPTFVDPRDPQYKQRKTSASSGAGVGKGGFDARFRRSKNVTKQMLEVDLEEIYTGCSKHIKIDGKVGLDSRVTVNIPAGVNEGWEYKQETKDGDIVFVVSSKPHRRFERSAENLVYKYCIDLRQALCGFTMSVTTLSGREIKQEISQIVRPGYRIFLADEGLPIPNCTGDRGYLIVEFDIEFPSYLEDKQKDSLSSVLQDSNFFTKDWGR